jgi:hypothetical protein
VLITNFTENKGKLLHGSYYYLLAFPDKSSQITGTFSMPDDITNLCKRFYGVTDLLVKYAARQ